MAQNIPTPGAYLARTAEDIAEGMMGYFVMLGTGVTDLGVGSVIRTELEAVAQMAEQFYMDQATALQDAITQSAYAAFNFVPLPAEPAVGSLVFAVASPGLAAPVTFSAGTIWSPSGISLSFGTTASLTIPAHTAGHYHVPARCISLGSAGSLVGGAPGSLQYPQPGVVVSSEDLVSHLDDVFVGSPPVTKGFTGGQDPETPLEMRARFTAFLSSLHRSTPDALEYGASLAQRIDPSDGSVIEQVKLARTIDVNIDPAIVPVQGKAFVYIYNGLGGTTNALLVAAQTIIDGSTVNGVFHPGYKAAGIDTEVKAADEYVATVAISVKPVGYQTAVAVSSAFLTTAVQQAVQSYFDSLKIGDTFYTSALLQSIVAVPGILSAYITALSIIGDVSSTSTVNDFVPPGNAIIRLAAGQPTVLVLT